MQRLRRQARRVRATYRRAARAVERRLRPDRLEVLCYHAVSETPPAFGVHHVRTSVLRDQLRWLGRHYQVVRLRDLPAATAAHAASPPWQRRPLVAITFDDGYLDTLEQAYPVLEAEGVPATVFVCPSVLGNAELLWRDKLRYVVDHGLGDALVAFLRGRGGRRYRFDLLASTSLYAWTKRRDAIGDMSIQADLDAFFVERGLSGAGLAAAARLFMAPADVKVRPLLDVGNHTWSHPVMTALDAAGQRAEIERADVALRGLGVAPVALALPFGDHDDATVRACLALGYQQLLTVQKRSNPLVAAAPGGLRVLHRRLAPPDVATLATIL